MNKKILLAISLSLTAMQAYGLDANEIRRFITNEISEPSEKLTPEKFFNNLATCATLVKEFIETTGKNDPDLMKAFGHAQNATNILINGMQECHRALDAKEYTRANSILRDFILVEKNIITMKDTINKTAFYFPGKREARDILATFAELLISIANRAYNDGTHLMH